MAFVGSLDRPIQTYSGLLGPLRPYWGAQAVWVGSFVILESTEHVSTGIEFDIVLSLVILKQSPRQKQLKAGCCLPQLLGSFGFPLTRGALRTTKGRAQAAAQSKSGSSLQ